MSSFGIVAWLYLRTTQICRNLATWLYRFWTPSVRENNATNPCSKHFEGTFGIGEFINGGSTALVERLSCGHARKVVIHWDDPDLRDMLLGDLEREHEIYQRIGKQTHFLEMIKYSSVKGMLILQGLPNGTLRDYLVEHADISTAQRFRWAIQISRAVQTLHSYHIIHCDIKPENALLDENYHAYLIDFAGSAIDDKLPTIMENDRFRLPDKDPEYHYSNTETDIFALGSTIFEIMTSQQPYADLPDDEVVKRYRGGNFPGVASIPCGNVILKCWRGQFATASEVHTALLGSAKS